MMTMRLLEISEAAAGLTPNAFAVIRPGTGIVPERPAELMYLVLQEYSGDPFYGSSRWDEVPIIKDE